MMGNLAWGIDWFRGNKPWSERERDSLDGEDVSPAQANPFRPRYTKPAAANLPEMEKPAIDREQTDE
jgi:hypothetical protein